MSDEEIKANKWIALDMMKIILGTPPIGSEVKAQDPDEVLNLYKKCYETVSGAKTSQ